MNAVKRKDLPKNQRGVALAWVHGFKMSSGHMRTDGDKVWSWRLVIGYTLRGEKVAINYVGTVSGSTTRHVREVVQVATETVEPGDIGS